MIALGALSPRRGDAGVTLVETLVVLVIIAAMAGMAATAVGRIGAPRSLARDAELLAIRMTLAAEEALLTGRDAALAWDSGSYRFYEAADGDWRPHAVAELGRPELLGAGARMGEGAGTLRIAADIAPPDPMPFRIELVDGGARATVAFDGLSARIDDSR